VRVELRFPLLFALVFVLDFGGAGRHGPAQEDGQGARESEHRARESDEGWIHDAQP
jgi:hypothetical protein